MSACPPPRERSPFAQPTRAWEPDRPTGVLRWYPVKACVRRSASPEPPARITYIGDVVRVQATPAALARDANTGRGVRLRAVPGGSYLAAGVSDAASLLAVRVLYGGLAT